MINNEILNFVQTAARNTPAPSKFKETFDNVVKRASIQGVIKQRLDNQKQVLENQEQVQRQAVEAQKQALEAQRQVPEEIQAAQEGGPIENAETDLEAMLGPMGVIDDNDGAPGPSLGGEGVADDLTMEVPEGSYILNSDGVALIGISDINKVIRDAYTIAAALGQELPADYDPQNKVPIRISNGEAVIPAPLVGIIGLDRLERWNAKGLEVRRQREEMEKAQAEAQAQAAPQPVTEAPPVQPMQAQMGEMMGFKDGDEVKEDSLSSRIIKFIFGSDPIGDVKNTVKEQEALRSIVDQLLKETDFTPQEIKKELDDLEKAEGGTIPSFKEGGFLNWIERQLGVALEEKEDPFKVTGDFRKKLDSWMDKYNTNRTDKKDYLNTNNALILAETIAMQESDRNPYERQDLTPYKRFKSLIREGSLHGPGRGLYQYEQDHSNREQIANLEKEIWKDHKRKPTDEEIREATQDAAETAVTRARNFDPNISWLSEFNDKDYDVRKLTGSQQTELFIIDQLQGDAPFIDTVNNANLTAEEAFKYWKNHHWRGKGSVSNKRRQEFIDNYNRNKSKLYSN